MPQSAIFDKKIKRIQRNRSSKIINKHNFLINETAKRLSDRINSEIKHNFETALDIGSRSEILPPSTIPAIIKIDSEISFLKKGSACADEEFLPFKKESFDLVTSNLDLHWVNDFPGTLMQIRNILKEKGLFLCSIFGGKTLAELRQVINEAELEETGGISPRLAPLIETKDAGILLQKCGFHLPVVDTEEITVLYPNFISLVKDLRGMGETNALVKRPQKPLSKKLVSSIEKKYRENFPEEGGTIKATFEILTLTGWKN
jgi:ubiquinone/menaquinone biosynthesis C-methylase UbiE